jgi:hypothetical protein
VPVTEEDITHEKPHDYAIRPNPCGAAILEFSAATPAQDTLTLVDANGKTMGSVVDTRGKV